MAGVALWFDDTVEVYIRNMEAFFFYYFMTFILRIVDYFLNIFFG